MKLYRLVLDGRITEFVVAKNTKQARTIVANRWDDGDPWEDSSRCRVSEFKATGKNPRHVLGPVVEENDLVAPREKPEPEVTTEQALNKLATLVGDWLTENQDRVRGWLSSILG